MVASRKIYIREGNSPNLNRQISEVQTARVIRVTLEDFPKGKIDASVAGQWMLPLLERSDAVINEASGTAPHHDITAFEREAAHRIGAAFTAPQEGSRQAKRN